MFKAAKLDVPSTHDLITQTGTKSAKKILKAGAESLGLEIAKTPLAQGAGYGTKSLYNKITDFVKGIFKSNKGYIEVGPVKE